MKKIISIIFILPALIVISSCDPFDVFDREPLDKISDSQVWEEESLLDAYIMNLYSRFPFESFPFGIFRDADKANQNYETYNRPSTIQAGGMSRTSESHGYWDYSYIRDLNVFIEKIVDSPIAGETKRHMEGQVRVMRAVVYFEKQKRYGGVPLVDVVLDPLGDLDEKFLVRSKEEEIADFIDSELTKAIELLNTEHSRKGMINRWTAYAYKARANLWSASIAKYGTLQINGLVGIPAGRANEFFQKAADAARTVIQSGRYELYDQIADKSENYRNLFIDDGNSEVIFERIFDGFNIGENYHNYIASRRFAATRGPHVSPFLDFLYGYENIDGTTDQPQFGPEHLYSDGIELWKNKDPRLRATVFLQGESYLGQTMQTYEGLDLSSQPDPDAIISGYDYYHNGIVAAGIDSRMRPDIGFRTCTGFLVRKYLVEKDKVPENSGSVNWKAIRLGEMYLTLAEAEYEMDNLESASEALNATRERAGISLVDAGSITLDHVRNERKYELAFEGFRWWDLRRWRITESVFNRDTPFQGLRGILHYESGEYYFLPMDGEGFTRIFRPEHYYNPIRDTRIENNNYLIENPGYE